MEITSITYDREDNLLSVRISLHNKGRRHVLAEIMHVLPENVEVESARLALDSFDEKSNKSYYASIEACSTIEIAEKTVDWTYNPNSVEQELYGEIHFADGSFLTRAENDGEEWWEHRFIPSVPELV